MTLLSSDVSSEDGMSCQIVLKCKCQRCIIFSLLSLFLTERRCNYLRMKKLIGKDNILVFFLIMSAFHCFLVKNKYNAQTYWGKTIGLDNIGMGRMMEESKPYHGFIQNLTVTRIPEVSLRNKNYLKML